ncbi:hypothetical protein B0A78_06720 [Flavobacterium columnare NBRC 100251 = ATCC 23463]|uniref:hypothetical protein n=1 Tax=Flavobacterium columnare TaxID=996 RepID=UPI0007F99539|nr:hypothetical protein [Flavobacterium columnare]ANO48013.1 hypothetical protein Pf1_02559 [Flavobacterium columnare]APT21411.1 hypothetical protein BU993_01405 [Flavobacterium columnare]PDS24506.1 hypothetical protein B0A78_06720 [Flavobacterium columnare NBRC 100251 = ATCC 23463]GEM59168.1 hypothetical protein FC1_24060 [Flavobacterium columnare NBRC 100251 = ATCC 23463]
MIQTENIPDYHSINSITPDFLITLPFDEKDVINETNVTCYFVVRIGLYKHKCLGVEFFDKIDTKILEGKTFKDYFVNYIYIFRGNPFNIIKEKEFFKV